MSKRAKPKIGVGFDDDFTSITTDVVRVWFTVGDKPDDTASLAVMVRSVGHNNKVQLGMHEIACRAARKAIEEAFAPGQLISVWMTVDVAEAEKVRKETHDEEPPR